MELVRVYKQMRKALYQPKEGLTPIQLEFLDTKRKTIMEFHEGRSVVKLSEARRDPQTISLVKASLKTAQKRQEQPVALRQERHRSSGEYAPREAFHREGYPRLLFLQQLLRMIRIFKTSILLFRKIRKSSREELQRSLRLNLGGLRFHCLAKRFQGQHMLEKLNNDVELCKLHVKHYQYHMSPAQFRRRTSMLGLPGEIYDKYDRIVRGCRVCSTSVPTPPRARIAGLRVW